MDAPMVRRTDVRADLAARTAQSRARPRSAALRAEPRARPAASALAQAFWGGGKRLGVVS